MFKDVSAYFKVFYKNDELSNATDFKYVYSEDEDDQCIINFEASSREYVDSPWLKINTQLRVLWGWINGIISEKRIIYVQEVKPRFADGDLVSVSITCGEKAISLKQNSGNHIFKQGSILDVMTTLADKNKLNAFLEVPAGATTYDMKKVFGDDETYKFYLKLQKTKLDPEKNVISKIYLQSPETKNILDSTRNSYNNLLKAHGFKPGDLVDPEALDAWRRQREGVSKLSGAFAQFTQNASIPQGGKSDRALISDMALREKAGPYVLDTRDDDITLKKRNFNKVPLKTYEFGASKDGDFLQFVPESRARIKSSASNNVGYGSWDRLNKEYYYGNSNLMNSPEVTGLAKWQYILNDLEKRDPNATFDVQKVQGSVGSNVYSQGANRGDNTIIQIQRINRITVGKAKQVLQDTLNDLGKRIDLAHAETPEQGFAQASNINGNSRNNLTPATARFEMNPLIKVGDLLTLLGLGKKYSGNYYVIKSSHGIDTTGYPYTECELVTDGFNAKESDNFLPSTKTIKKINQSIGPRQGKGNLKIIKQR